MHEKKHVTMISMLCRQSRYVSCGGCVMSYTCMCVCVCLHGSASSGSGCHHASTGRKLSTQGLPSYRASGHHRWALPTTAPQQCEGSYLVVCQRQKRCVQKPSQRPWGHISQPNLLDSFSHLCHHRNQWHKRCCLRKCHGHHKSICWNSWLTSFLTVEMLL